TGLVGARLLHGLLRPRPAILAGPAAAPATSAAAAARLYRPQSLAIGRAAAAGLARCGEALAGAAAPAARLILVAEADVAAGRDALVALGHDLALVDPDLDADPAERRLGLGEAVVDVGADGVQGYAALGVGLRAAHLAAA